MSSDQSAAKRPHSVGKPFQRISTWLFGFRFQPDVEAAFQLEMADLRYRRAKRTGWIAVVLYMLFSVNDQVMLPDAYRQAWLVRAMIFPFMVAGIFCAIKLRSVVLRDIAASAAVIVAGIGLAWIGLLSRHPNAAHYHTGIILVTMFGNIVLNMRRRYAVATSMVLLAVYAACLANIDAIPEAVRFNIWMVFFSSVLISLLANFQMDHDRRMTFYARSREVELLKKLSTEDPLTQLANRREFDYCLESEWGRARREGQSIAMIMVDIDYFKNYNDHYGHPAGDLCLQKVAAVLKSIPQRSSDLVARYGGEEFVILLPNATPSTAAKIAERMRQAILELNLQHAASPVAPVVSASIGVASTVPLKQENSAELLTKADAALYRAKQNGRNQVAVQNWNAAVPAH